MTGAICPHHAVAINRPQVAQVTQERVGVLVGACTPGGVRMEAVPLVDQNSLCTFEDEWMLVREAFEDTHRAERKPPRELDHRLGDVPRSVRIRQESHLLWQNTRFGHNRQPFTKLRLLELLLPLQFLEQKRQVTQVVRVDRQFRKREHVGHRFTDTHTHTAVTSGSTKRFPHPVGCLLKRRNRERTTIDNHSREWVAGDELRERVRFVPKRKRIKQHVVRKKRPRTRDEHAAAELRKRVMFPAGGVDVVCGLSTAVEANDDRLRCLASQVVDHGAFTSITKAKVSHNWCMHDICSIVWDKESGDTIGVAAVT